MTQTRPWKPPEPTTALVASFEDMVRMIEEKIPLAIEFPVLAIPFGANEETPCRFFESPYDTGWSRKLKERDPTHFDELLRDARPMPDGVRRVHIIHWRMFPHAVPLDSTFRLLHP